MHPSHTLESKGDSKSRVLYVVCDWLEFIGYWKNNPEEVATSQKKRNQKPTPRVSVEAIDDFDRGVIRRAIYGMYDRNEHVTLDTLLDVILANPGPGTASIFEGGRTTLYKLLHEIGFSWQKTSGRKVLMEDVNVAAKKIAFLKEYRKLAAENNFVFLDETWIFSKGECFFKKYIDSIALVKSNIGKGLVKRLLLAQKTNK
uniref:Transposase n=1 Tax=Timema cristinae TaxID=61476 RepID=A0A7R9HH07_TIMCR|nr:unnamed protein product [Timema cristinae]